MGDEDKTKEELTKELAELRQRVVELEKAEEKLKESEEKYRTTFENTGTAMAILEEDTTISLVNSQFEKLSGYSKKEIEGKMSWTKFVHPDDLEKMIEYHKKRRKKPEEVPKAYEFRAIDKNGNIINMLINVDLIPGTKKSVISLIDTTELKRAEEELQKSEEKYRSLVENINTGIYRNTPGTKGKFIEANPAIIEMFGYGNRKEFLKINVSDLYQNSEDRKKFNEKILKNGFVRNEELKLKKKDGTLIWASVTATAVYDENGEVKYYDGMIEDITER
ncbi:MAG: PAS domain-containing protein, partial [Candidatus Thermoplasmatota archaeon]|nr:PAS domain-containing protein [Candidatus Thermoplasmatota archaeon]